MTTLKRRPSKVAVPPSGSPGRSQTREESGTSSELSSTGRPAKGTPPIRMQDAVLDNYGPREREFYDDRVAEFYEKNPDKAKQMLATFMRNSLGKDRPYCTCSSVKGWSFDPQIGIFLHAVVDCWKPSKAYFTAAVLAGILDQK